MTDETYVNPARPKNGTAPSEASGNPDFRLLWSSGFWNSWWVRRGLKLELADGRLIRYWERERRDCGAQAVNRHSASCCRSSSEFPAVARPMRARRSPF